MTQMILNRIVIWIGPRTNLIRTNFMWCKKWKWKLNFLIILHRILSLYRVGKKNLKKRRGEVEDKMKDLTRDGEVSLFIVLIEEGLLVSQLLGYLAMETDKTFSGHRDIFKRGKAVQYILNDTRYNSYKPSWRRGWGLKLHANPREDLMRSIY